MTIHGIDFEMDEPVNLFRATTACSAFHIFLSAAKVSLFPFLTLFLRLIGLSAWQTGIVMSAKALTNFFWTPMWARCAVVYNVQRFILVMSVVMMGVTYISLTGAYFALNSSTSCEVFSSHLSEGIFNASVHGEMKGNATKTHDTSSTDVRYNLSVLVNDITTQTFIASEYLIKNSTHFSSWVPVASRYNTSLLLKYSPTFSVQNTTSISKLSAHEREFRYQKLNKQAKSDTGSMLSDIPLDDVKRLIHTSMNLSLSEADLLLDNLQLDANMSTVSSSTVLARTIRSLNKTFLNHVKEKINLLTGLFEEETLLCFATVLLIIVIGEFLCSPLEKVADDAWSDFLERIDDVERYGRQRYFASFSYVLMPIIVTVLVDKMPCLAFFNIEHFLIHILFFVAFIFIALLIVFCFPIPPPIRHGRAGMFAKSLHAIICDGRGFLFVVTLLLTGAVHASFSNFLFWRLQDLGSSEVTMGVCVSVAAMSEGLMLIFNNKLVRKLGNSGVTTIALVALAIRVLYYGFLWTPWAVLPAEVLNAFTHTSLWYAVLNYEQFNVGFSMNQSIRSILVSVNCGLGFAIGSLISGMVYEMYGADVLFRGASILTGVWCLLFSTIQICLPKKERVNYVKLLQNDERNSSDDGDWLEMVLKDH